MKTVTKYLSDRGTEHNSPEEAEMSNKIHELHNLLLKASGFYNQDPKLYRTKSFWTLINGIYDHNPDIIDRLIMVLKHELKTNE